jgi:hypothetical protein
MAGATVAYDHLPSFYSDLFELGYEAVDALDSRLETVADWKEPYHEGVVYYLRDGRVRGVLLWNVWEQVDTAQRLVAEAGPVPPGRPQGAAAGLKSFPGTGCRTGRGRSQRAADNDAVEFKRARRRRPLRRSASGRRGLAMHAPDGDMGAVDDCIVDDESWVLRSMVVDTCHWWPGKHVLVSPRWIASVRWTQSSVVVDLVRETIKAAPEYAPSTLLNRAYETRLHQGLQRAPYWEGTVREPLG